MSPLAQTVTLLLILVTLLLAACLGYAIHRHPALTAPFAAATTAVTLVITCISTIASR
ncbi:hypothetical protein [Streptomyces sp. NPDC095817]|uniref:hypothetical protein n=1 Tax=Streptomyces sp. NPDC095817 TaxID=3155082 RepID=UPI00331ACA9B